MSAPAGEETGSGLREQIQTLLVAVVLALLIRTFAIEPFRIPSGSMLPTLLIGDHLFVNKFIYGMKIPFTEIRLPGLREPERGEVVVFTVARDGHETHPADLHPDLPRDEFVKRIVALPGDSVEIRDDAVYVNGERIEAQPLGEAFRDGNGRSLDVVEVSQDGRSYQILDDPQKPTYPVETTVVPPGRYFLMGDNRDDSQDSRKWGTVRLSEMRGPAFVLYWSWDFQGSWPELASPFTWWELLTLHTRWDRIGAGVR